MEKQIHMGMQGWKGGMAKAEMGRPGTGTPREMKSPKGDAHRA